MACPFRTITSALVAAGTSTTADYLILAIGATPKLSLASLTGGNTAGIGLFGQPSAAVGTKLTVENQVDISGSAADGILVDQGAAGAAVSLTVTDTALHNNGGDGLDVKKGTIALPVVSLGQGTGTCLPTPRGVDSIYCNQIYGVEADTPVGARGNKWDHTTPTSGAAPADVSDAAFVDTTCSLGAATGACML